MTLKLVVSNNTPNDEQKIESPPSDEFDEVEIIVQISALLCNYYKLRTIDALYVIHHLKEGFENLLKAEEDGTLDEFQNKLNGGKK